jgi:NhaP-type Na+/H+ or K+/H+ antiporter
MHIRYSPALDDYKEYQRMYFNSLAGFWVRNHLLIFVSFGLLVSIAGFNWNLNRQTPQFYGLLCVALGLCLVWRALWFRSWRWSRWFSRNVYKFHDLEGDITVAQQNGRTSTNPKIAHLEFWGTS